MGRRYPRTIVGLGCLLLMCAGCVWITPSPGPEAVLAGTWLVEQDRETVITELYWVFDANGNLTSVKFKVPTFLGDATVTDTVTSQNTTVNGNAVTVQVGTPSSNQTFAGTLNDAQDRIEGTFSLNYNFFGTTVEIDQGNATLVKQ